MLDRIARFATAVALTVAVSGAAAAMPVASDIRIGVHPEKTRFVVELSEDIRFEITTLADPYRIVVSLPETAWQLPSGTDSRGGVISRYRYGLFHAGASRIVIDAEAPTVVRAAFVIPPRGNFGYRLVVDLQEVSRTAFFQSQRIISSPVTPGLASPEPPPQRAALSVPTPPVAPQRPQGETRGAKWTVVIDPGHGGVDPGAIGVGGTWEKNIVMAFARELRRELLAKGNFRVVLTRDRDVFIRLRDRIAIAREAGGDIFISLHADKMPDSRVRGATIYTLSEKSSDEEAAQLAARENKADLIAGVDLEGQSDDVTTILIDLAQRETMNRSADLAKGLVDELSKTTRLIRNAHRFAGFAVLKAPDVPSVLIELGYLSNPKEEHLLNQQRHQKRVAAGLAEGISQFFGRNQAFRRP